MSNSSARPTSTNELTQLVNQAHTFTVGKAVIFNGAWVLSQADSLVNCAGTWIVSIVIDANSFYVTQTGYVNNLPAQTANVQLYLSPSVAGSFTTVRPTAVGEVILPCLVCDTTTTGYFYGGSGDLIVPSSGFTWTIEGAGPVNMVVNNGYMTASGGTITLNLPAVAAIGDIVKITNLSGNFSVTCGIGQTLQIGNNLAATSVTSSDVGDSLEIVCFNANTDYQILNSMGNLTIV